MNTAAYPSSIPQRRLAWVMVGLLLVVSILISQRSFLMMVQAEHTPIISQISSDSSYHSGSIQAHNTTTSDSESSPASHNTTTSDFGNSSTQHNHAEHCPLCFVYWMTGDFVSDFGSVYSPLLLKKLWLEAAVARAEFLNRIAARGPPKSSF
jgi:hypothetical protein